MDQGWAQATTRRSPAVALLLMGVTAFERRAGGLAIPAVAPAPPARPGQRTTTLRRGGFGLLGDRASLDDETC